MSTRTPTLTAWGYSAHGPQLSFVFTVCENESMSSGCFSSSAISTSSKWKVPAGKLKWSKQYWWNVTVTDTSTNLRGTSQTTTFTTGVRQPLIGSQLAARGGDGQEFSQQAGNYTTAATDLSIATVGPPLSVTRSYNSMDARTDGLFGAGWSTRWDMKLVREERGTLMAVLLTYPDGRRVRFVGNGDGTFQPPPGMYATLAETSGGGWRLMDKASTSYLFDAQGHVIKITDARGREQDLVHGTDGKLVKVTATGGRSLHFTWNGAHVATVSSDPVHGNAVTWTYHYEGDKLTAVCAPVPAPNCTRYTYNTGSLYRGVVQDTEPYGYWRLGETGGSSAADLGSGAGDASYAIRVGGNVLYSQPGPLTGTTDTAVQLNNASLELPDHALTNIGDQASVEMWFKTSGAGVLMSAAEIISYLPNGPILYVGTDGKLRGSYNASGSPASSTAVVNDNQWHHVALSVAGDQQVLYLDGQQVGTLTEPLTAWRPYAVVGNGVVTRGSAPGLPTGSGTQELPFNGLIDEVAIYGKPLTANEVSQHYAARVEAPHKLAGITLPSGRIWAANTFDARTERLKTHTDQHGGTWQIGVPVYDRQTGNSTVTVTDPHNGTLKYVYDAWRGYRLVSETDQLGKSANYDYDTGGFPSKITDANGNAVERSSDKRGNVLTSKTCRTTSSCQTSYYAYHVNELDPFDARNDQLTVSRDPRSSSATDNTYATKLTYTEFGEQSKQTTPPTSDFPDGRAITYVHSDGSEPAIGGGTTPAGLVKAATDPKGNETTYRYTAAGDLAEHTGPSGLVTKYQHDALGRVVSRTEVSSAHPAGVTTTFTYDAMSRLATHTGPGTKNEVSGVTHTAQSRLAYDADGNTLTDTVVDLTGGDPERKTSYTYDDYGRTESVTGPEGGLVRYAWDHVGARTSVTDELGNVFHYSYTSRGELASRVLKNWTGSPISPQTPRDVVLESYSYDPAGRLAASVDAMGRKLSHTYFGDDSLAESIADDVKLNGATTAQDVVLESSTYDATGNLISVSAAGNKQRTDYVYDAAGRLTSQMFDPSGLARKTVFVYDANDNIVKTTSTGAGSSRAEATEFAYNADDIVVRRTVENGDVDIITTRTVDDRGLTTAVTDPRGHVTSATPADFTTTYRYDLSGQLIETQYPQVVVEKSGSAVNAKPTVKTGYDSAGRETHSVDAEGRTSVAAFDRLGRLTSVTAPAYTPPGGQTLVTKVSYAYDAAGRQTGFTNERGAIHTIEYDALGNPVRLTAPAPGGQRVFEYDLLGEQLAETDPAGARTEATYDDLGRQITRTVIERKPAPIALTTQMEYDRAGELTMMVAPGGKTSRYEINAAGEMTSLIDPLGNTTKVSYDLAGRTIKSSDPLGNASVIEYDLAGRRIGAKDLDTTGATLRSVSSGYDAASNEVRTTSAEGHVTTMRYDALSELVELVEPVSANKTITTSYGYDATGELTRTTDGRGNTVWSTYNSLGLVESMIEPATQAHPAVQDRTWTNVYDAAGNLTSVQQPGGIRLDRQFDALDRVIKETGTGASVPTPERTYGYDTSDRQTAIGDYALEYNDRGLLTRVSKSSGQVAAFKYDTAGNPVERTDASSTTTFGWDNGERLATAADPVSGRSFTYTYDDADRLTTLTSANPATTQSFGYDSTDRLTSHIVKNSAGTQLAKIAYTWDRDDNLISKVSEGTAGAGANTYGYDQLGRITSWKAPDGNTITYTWDASGNRTSAGDKSFTFDERNRLISGGGTDYTYTPRGTIATETTGGATKNLAFDAFDQLVSDGDVTYGYDALGRVVSRRQGSEDERFIYSGTANDIVAITDSTGTVKSRYGRSPSGELLGIEEGGQKLGVMSDLHDDMVATLSGDTLADSIAYSPFGEALAQTGTKRSLGYQGEYTDPATGKVNMHARWYMPGTGGFASRDDWTLSPYPSINLNRYTYGNANPLANTDPSGHCPICIPLLVAAARVVIPVVVRVVPRVIQAVSRARVPAGRTPLPKSVSKAQPKVPPKPQSSKAQTKPNPNPKSQAKPNPKPKIKSKTKPKAKSKPKPQPKVQPRVPPKVQQKPSTSRPSTSKPSTSRSSTSKPSTSKASKSKAPKTKGPKSKAKSKTPSKTPSKSPSKSRNPDKIEHTQDIFSDARADVGAPDIGGFSGCTGWRNCAKDVIEEFVDNTVDNAINDLMDEAAPDLPLDSPGSCDISKSNSFVSGTRVLTADGSTKAIEDIKVGDYVLAADPEAGTRQAKPVITLITGNGIKNLVKISVDIDGSRSNGTDVITSTDEHPFWIPALGAWLDADQLQPGMWLQTSAGTHVQITAIKKWTATQRVHNLTVEGFHTYHVLAGDQAILVHNDDPGKRKRAADLPWNENATGDHTVFERDENGRINRYQTWIEEPRSPFGWRKGPRFRGAGGPHSGIEPPLYYPKGGGYGEQASGDNLPRGYGDTC